MLIRAIEIARLYLFTTFRQRSTLIFGFILPLVFTFILGQIFGSAFNESQASWQIGVSSEDAGTLGQDLLTYLEADPTIEVVLDTEEEILLMVEREQVVAGLLLPATFSEEILDSNIVTVDLHISNNSQQEGQLIEQALAANFSRLAGALNVAQTSERLAERVGLFEGDSDPDLRTEYQTIAKERANEAWANPPVTLETKQATRNESQQDQIPVGFGQSAPANFVIFSMFFMLGGTAVLVQEREEGTLRRLLVMPMHKGTILFGKLLGVYLSGVIQIAILIVVGALAFRIDWGQSPVGLALMVLSFAFAITSLGMLVAALVRTLRQANSLPTAIILPMCALGGAMWPIEITPQWMQQLGHAFPVAWAMGGFNDLITRGLGTSDILLEAGVLMLYGLAFLAIGIWRFRYE